MIRSCRGLAYRAYRLGQCRAQQRGKIHERGGFGSNWLVEEGLAAIGWLAERFGKCPYFRFQTVLSFCGSENLEFKAVSFSRQFRRRSMA